MRGQLQGLLQICLNGRKIENQLSLSFWTEIGLSMGSKLKKIGKPGREKAVHPLVDIQHRIALSNQVQYVCHINKHKEPKGYGDCCHKDFGRDTQRPLEMLKSGLLAGAYSEKTLHNSQFPKQVWFFDSKLGYFEAQCQDSTNGIYHGYPIKPAGVPKSLKNIDWNIINEDEGTD